MKKILIIYPHFPPSNLAGVHRPRLFAQHLSDFGWEPVVLTVKEKFYEEEPDWNLLKLLPENLRIEKVNAFKITRPRLIGDIGLRAFFQLHKKAKQLIVEEKFDFVYIPIPSFYCALIGRWLHKTTGIPYGIDYIDPWVHVFPGSDKIFSRHWFTTQVAKLLEPIAVKKASLITGVAPGYFTEVLKRNPHLKHQAVTGAMPYGGEALDHVIMQHLQLQPYLFEKREGKMQLVYAGAMLPKAYAPLERLFKNIKANLDFYEKIEFHFIGTGKTADDENGYNIKDMAERYELWNSIVFEYPKRIPYLDVLIHLQQADGIFILGSTEPHYTPSKSYQGVLSGKPILALLHEKSTAVHVLKRSGSGSVFSFDGEAGLDLIEYSFHHAMKNYQKWSAHFQPTAIDTTYFDAYSAREITKQLSLLLDKSIKNNSSWK